MELNPGIFRQYDIRGVVGSDLTPQVAGLIGRGFARYLRQKGVTADRAVVGRDNRLSSDELASAVVDGLTSEGLDVVDCGTITTPMFYYSRILYDIDPGIMVTGSHNPPDNNGFKIALGPATIHGDEIQELRRVVESSARDGEAPGMIPRGTITRNDPTEEYISMLCGKIALGPKPLKVVVDCGNGTASLSAPVYLEKLGCEVIPLFCESDGHFPNHHPDPVKSENLVALRETVLREKADLGVAYDGDADRIGVVSDDGTIVWGDTLMILYWREILPKHPGADVIIEVKCSQALVDEVKRLGGNPVFYKTGHSLIKAKMREIGALFTGEMSGHMFFADEYFGFDDAFYATGRLLRILSNTGKKLSELLADVPKYFSTAETRVECPDDRKFDVVDELTREFRKRYEVIDVDGARVIFPGGWGLVRASNTQPVIVARCEGKTKEDLAFIESQMKQALEKYPEVKPFEWEY